MAPLGFRLRILVGAALFLIPLTFSGQVFAQKELPRPANIAREIALARDYVFAACLIRRYPNSELANEANVWASGLIENGSIPGERYPKLADIARNSAPAPLSSEPGVPMLMQSCLGLYNSPTLPGMIRRVLMGR